MSSRSGTIIQARTGSVRFPGKVLADLHGEPMILREVERLQRTPGIDAIVVATTDNPADDALADCIAAAEGVDLFRGPEADVLARFAGAAAAFELDVIGRVTGDCPLIDPAIAAHVFGRFHAEPGCDYASICRPRSYPHGMDIEIVSRTALDAAASEASDPFDREHVLVYVFTQPERFRCINLTAPDPGHVGLRLTVDYPDDLSLVRAIYTALYDNDPAFDLAAILRLLEQRPDIASLNRDVPAHESITEASQRGHARAVGK
jgi:spore coat polysaccharide biosynthesis protein SpsF